MGELREYSVRAFITVEVEVPVEAASHKEAEELVENMFSADPQELINDFAIFDDPKLHGVESIEIA